MADPNALDATIRACREVIDTRFRDGSEHGAAAMLLRDGTILTGTAPDAVNPSVEVCHEIEPFCAAYRLDRPIVASVCLHRLPSGRHVVLSPCGVCRERLAVHGPDVLVAVPDAADLETVRWVTLRETLPYHWLLAFPDELPTWVASRPQPGRWEHRSDRDPDRMSEQ